MPRQATLLGLCGPSQWRSYRGAGGGAAILAIKNYTFSYMLSNLKCFFVQNFLILKFLPPPGRFCPPPPENFLAHKDQGAVASVLEEQGAPGQMVPHFYCQKAADHFKTPENAPFWLRF